ncbi:MAG: sn-glycerol-3-phosphate ABC transporter ATP-binding protein UgpC [Acidobacteriota bacterium]|nr:sn-glycerol-3-phosphate ABC transporter ATP-binding protein UgpC [Acidobacteriota bacterium]
MAAIEIEAVSKRFEAGSAPAVDDVSLSIGDGEFMVLVGPSGSGKTTLLRMIAGLETTSGGHIRLGGRDITGVLPKDRDLAMVFQNYALYPHMTVFDNLAYGLRVRKTRKAEVAQRVNEAARLLDIDELLQRKPAALSGGQRQRVAMGRAIVREPAAFMMDEPLSNLDAKLRVGMRASLARLHARLRTTTVYVTHDQTEAMTLGHRVAVLRDGRLLQVDTPQELYQRPINLFVAAFIGSPAMNLIGGTIEGDAVRFAGIEVPVPPRFEHAGPDVVIGIRPEDLADASLIRDRPALDVVAEVVEDLGADKHVLFTLDALPVRAEGLHAASEAGDELGLDEGAVFNARLDNRTRVRAGEQLRLAVDPERLYLFDPDSGRSLLAA